MSYPIYLPRDPTNPLYCGCGCGTEITPGTTRRGQPRRFVEHHSVRATNKDKTIPRPNLGKCLHPDPVYTYILHFDPPYKHARHYKGLTRKTVQERLATHRAGQGSALIRAVVAAGCTVTIGRVWRHRTVDEAYAHERLLKLRGAAGNCGICQRRAKALGINPRSKL